MYMFTAVSVDTAVDADMPHWSIYQPCVEFILALEWCTLSLYTVMQHNTRERHASVASICLQQTAFCILAYTIFLPHSCACSHTNTHTHTHTHTHKHTRTCTPIRDESFYWWCWWPWAGWPQWGWAEGAVRVYRPRCMSPFPNIKHHAQYMHNTSWYADLYAQLIHRHSKCSNAELLLTVGLICTA